MASDNKAKILREAEKYVIQGKIPQAIAEYQKITKLDPNDVMILNTIGDLYLRQGKVTDANQYFLQVAENYSRNNFLLKALAVYKKILNSDPQNLVICRTMATLYSQQGLNADARIHYLKAAEIATREGRAREATESYEKIVEIEPGNSTVQLKLAEIRIAEGNREKAYENLAAAARAQVKAGSLQAALASFGRALEIHPLDAAVLRGYCDAAVAAGVPDQAVAQLGKALERDPNNLEILEMSGRAQLSAGNADGAAEVFRRVIEQDETRLPLVLEIHKARLAADDPDGAGACLDPYIESFIARRSFEQVVKAHQTTLSVHPSNIPTLRRLEKLFSSVNDHARRLEMLDNLAQVYLDSGEPKEALVCLESILQVNFGSKKHQEMHREAFLRAYPGERYTPPEPGLIGETEESAKQGRGPAGKGLAAPAAGSEVPTLVEIDLLINYGMTDRALELLRSMHEKDPANREALTRMVSLLRDTDPAAAADCCMTLALVHKNAGEDGDAARLRSEAELLDPGISARRSKEWDASAEDLSAAGGGTGAHDSFRESAVEEVDLTGDISDIFFHGTEEEEAGMGSEGMASTAEDIVEEYTPADLPQAKGSSLTEQLQEVDFYLNLGFLDEAKTRLEEIVKEHGKIPELASRLSQLADGAPLTPQPEFKTQVEGEVVPEFTFPSEAKSGSLPADRDTLPLEFELTESPYEVTADRAQAPETDVAPSGVIALGPPTASAKASPEAIALGPPEAAKPGAAPDRVVADRGEGVEKAKAAETPGLEPSHLQGSLSESVPQPKSAFEELLAEVTAETDREVAWEDFETLFSLGTAYREMGLVDDAIREFQGAAKALDPAEHPREIIRCCGMLSTCFLEKRMPHSAMRWCDAGLSVPDISEHEIVALRYEMGIALSLSGDNAKALSMFEFVYGVDPAFRDVAQKIDELRSGSSSHAS